MVNVSRSFVVASGAAAVLSLAGCSAAPTAGGPSVTPVVTSSSLAPLSPPPSPTGTTGGIDVAIAAADSAVLRPGGEPMAFTVTLANTTPAEIEDVRLVVSFGHCACGYPGASIMPGGTMRMLDQDSGAWTAAPYVVEGTGTDYLNQTLVPPFVLAKGQTMTYRLEARLDANPDVTAGASLLTVTIQTPTDRGHPAALRVTVEP